MILTIFIYVFQLTLKNLCFCDASLLTLQIVTNVLTFFNLLIIAHDTSQVLLLTFYDR